MESLRPHQQAGLDWLHARRDGVLAFRMGYGKTRVAIEEAKLDGSPRILVVAPKYVALNTWPAELDKWWPGVEYKVIDSPKKGGEDAVRTPARVYIIGRDNLFWLANKVVHREVQPFDLLILDELSSFKSVTSQRQKAAYALSVTARRVFGLTGTLTPQGAIDLWSQMRLVKWEHWLAPNFGAYKQKFFQASFADPRKLYINQGAMETLQRLVEPVVASASSAEVEQYMPQVYPVKEVGVPNPNPKLYAAFRNDALKEVEEAGYSDPQTLLGALSAKTLQWSSGYVYDRDHNPVYVNRAKADRFVELLEELDGDPVLVLYGFRSEIPQIRKAAPDAELITDPGVIDRWNRGEVRVAYGHPASMGHGLNLQEGGSNIIWWTPTYNSEHWEQANARLARMGQRNPVSIQVMVMDGTDDHKVLMSAQGKVSWSERFIKEMEL